MRLLTEFILSGDEGFGVTVSTMSQRRSHNGAPSDQKFSLFSNLLVERLQRIRNPDSLLSREGKQMSEPYELTAAQAAQQIRERQLSPVDLMESIFRRIDSLEPRLNAWVYLDRESVLSDAGQKQAELDAGSATGLLHGVPIGLKDIYYTAGIPTTACSKVYADFVPYI